jgi:hypothetical protein
VVSRPRMADITRERVEVRVGNWDKPFEYAQYPSERKHFGQSARKPGGTAGRIHGKLPNISNLPNGNVLVEFGRLGGRVVMCC